MIIVDFSAVLEIFHVEFFFKMNVRLIFLFLILFGLASRWTDILQVQIDSVDFSITIVVITKLEVIDNPAVIFESSGEVIVKLFLENDEIGVFLSNFGQFPDFIQFSSQVNGIDLELAANHSFNALSDPDAKVHFDLEIVPELLEDSLILFVRYYFWFFVETGQHLNHGVNAKVAENVQVGVLLLLRILAFCGFFKDGLLPSFW